MKEAKRNDKIDNIVCFAVHIYCIYIYISYDDMFLQRERRQTHLTTV